MKKESLRLLGEYRDDRGAGTVQKQGGGTQRYRPLCAQIPDRYKMTPYYLGGIMAGCGILCAGSAVCICGVDSDSSGLGVSRGQASEAESLEGRHASDECHDGISGQRHTAGSGGNPRRDRGRERHAEAGVGAGSWNWYLTDFKRAFPPGGGNTGAVSLS